MGDAGRLAPAEPDPLLGVGEEGRPGRVVVLELVEVDQQEAAHPAQRRASGRCSGPAPPGRPPGPGLGPAGRGRSPPAGTSNGVRRPSCDRPVPVAGAARRPYGRSGGRSRRVSPMWWRWRSRRPPGVPALTCREAGCGSATRRCRTRRSRRLFPRDAPVAAAHEADDQHHDRDDDEDLHRSTVRSVPSGRCRSPRAHPGPAAGPCSRRRGARRRSGGRCRGAVVPQEPLGLGPRLQIGGAGGGRRAVLDDAPPGHSCPPCHPDRGPPSRRSTSTTSTSTPKAAATASGREPLRAGPVEPTAGREPSRRSASRTSAEHGSRSHPGSRGRRRGGPRGALGEDQQADVGGVGPHRLVGPVDGTVRTRDEVRMPPARHVGGGVAAREFPPQALGALGGDVEGAVPPGHGRRHGHRRHEQVGAVVVAERPAREQSAGLQRRRLPASRRRSAATSGATYALRPGSTVKRRWLE